MSNKTAAPRVSAREELRARLGRIRRRLPGQRMRRATRLGFEFDFDLNDNAQRHLYRSGRYEPEFSDFLVGELGEGDVYADIGAHIGIHALVCARELKRLGGRAFAFEPTPDSAKRLRDAASRAGLDNLTLVETCLGSAPGTLELRADPSYGRHDAGVRSAYGPGAVVGSFPVTTFDLWAAAAGLDRLDVVKIDVEGAEHEVIRGMRTTLRELRPRTLAIEMEDYLLERAGVASEDLVALLDELSYTRAPESFGRNVVFRLALSPTLP